MNCRNKESPFIDKNELEFSEIESKCICERMAESIIPSEPELFRVAQWDLPLHQKRMVLEKSSLL